MRFKWESLVYVFVVLPLLFVILWVIAALFPSEEVPRVEPAANGTTLYVIQSLGEAVLWVVGTVLFFVVTVAYAVVITRYRRETWDAKPAPLFPRWIGWVCASLIVLALLTVFIGIVFIVPYSHYRKLAVGPDQIVLSGLYRSWTIPRSDIKDVELLREEQVGRHAPAVDLQYVVTTKRDERFVSVRVEGLRPHDAVLKQHQTVFDDLAKSLRAKAGVRDGARPRGGK